MKMDSKTYMVIGAGIASIIGGMILGNAGSHSQNRSIPHPPLPVNRVQMPPVKPPSLPQTSEQTQNTDQSNNNSSVKPPQVQNQNSTVTEKKKKKEKKEKITEVHHYTYHPVHHAYIRRRKEIVKHEIHRKKRHKEKQYASADLSYIKQMSVVCKLNQSCRLTDGVKSYRPGDRIGKYYIKEIGLLSVELKTADGKEIRVRLTQ